MVPWPLVIIFYEYPFEFRQVFLLDIELAVLFGEPYEAAFIHVSDHIDDLSFSSSSCCSSYSVDIFAGVVRNVEIVNM
jgi:hypothetical protein